MLRDLGVSPARMFRAPLPIDEALYLDFAARRSEERASARAAMGVSDEAVVVLFAGKLSDRKRPRDLVEAWARLRERSGSRHEVVLLFCGDGPLKGDLSAAIDRVGATARLVVFVNVDRLPAYYCAADILVHPSEHDPHPLNCSEAACIGLPLVLSDRIGAIGPTDIARAGENALVYRCGDIDDLVAAIERLIGDRTLRRRMSAKSRAVYEDVGLKATLDGMARALKAIVPGPSAPN